MTLEQVSHILVSIEYFSYTLISALCVILGALLLALLIVWAIYHVVNAILVKLKMIPFLLEFAKWKREQANKNIDWIQE